MAGVSREELIQFARRDWAAVAAAKEQHWLRLKHTMTYAELCRRSDELLRYARAARSGQGSSPADRVADVLVHHRVGLALRAVTRPTR